MLSALFLLTALVAAPEGDERAAYDAAKLKAGRDAAVHVKLALWCEQRGWNGERARQLAQAVLIDPKNEVARGLMGMVSFQGQWQRPKAVAAKLKADAEHAAKIEQYSAQRARTAYTADAQWKLALWCEENELKQEAITHLRATVRIDPSRAAAWKHLGYQKQGGRWVTDEQRAQEKQEKTRQEQANRHWKPLLEKWRGWIGEKGKHREEADRALATVTDPRAVPMVWEVLARGNAERQILAVQLFGQIDAPAASRDLALLSVFSPVGRRAPASRRVAQSARSARLRGSPDWFRGRTDQV